MGDEYRRFWIASREAEWRERLLAEAFEAGAEGAEEVDEPARAGSAAQFRACLYARTDAVEAVRGVLLDLLRGTSSPAAEVGAAEDLPSVDWSEAWKHGLGPIVISERLVVRPPFAPFEPLPGQREIVIDPGQAFGTGTHASTLLCLDWLDQLLSDAAGRARFARVLDVGTGSGILALAAVALGASPPRVLAAHVFPNITAPLIVHASLNFAFAVLAEASLAFLGLGNKPPAPSWGSMVSASYGFLQLAPWAAIVPGVAIALAVLGFNLLGDGLRDALDPRMRT